MMQRTAVGVGHHKFRLTVPVDGGGSLNGKDNKLSAFSSQLLAKTRTHQARAITID
jgi:hypothetical protein